jgi:hypothetical protein
MQLLRNYPYLTGLMVLLVALKFLLVPLYQWQNDTLWSISQNDKRLSRANSAITNINSNRAQLAILQQQRSKLQALFYPWQAEASFKLEQQQILEALLAKHNFKVNNIGWTYSAKILGQPFIKHQLSVSFAGETFELPKLYLALENKPQWIEVVNFSFNLIGQKEQTLGKFRGSLDLVFYQIADSSRRPNDKPGAANE